jgi:uridine kinase
LDHGVPGMLRPLQPPEPILMSLPESHIIFLAYLVSRRGILTIHRAFPAIQIVTAAIDTGLHEMHFPLNSLVMGEAAGEADFAVRLVDDTEDVEDQEEVDGGRVMNENLKAEGGGLKAVKTEKELIEEGFRVPVNKTMEELKFSRGKGAGGARVREKRAWVVSPGESASIHLIKS